MPGLFRSSSDAAKWQKQMGGFLGELAPLAISETLTEIAQRVQFRSIINMKSDFIKVSPYTIRSIRVWKASPKANITRINSKVGTISPYLDVQEEGGDVKPRVGKNLPVPTMAARSGDLGRAIAPRFRMNRLGDLKAKGNRFILLRPTSPVGRLRHAAIFYRQGKRLIKLRNLDRTHVLLKPKHWHARAVAARATQVEVFRLFVQNIKALGR